MRDGTSGLLELAKKTAIVIGLAWICGCPEGDSATDASTASGLDATHEEDVGSAADAPGAADAHTAEDGDLGRDAGSDAGCDCDDGIECTADSCVGTACEHVADHTRCADGQYCDGTSGCRAGGACATVADCSAPDACAVPRCDPSLRRCLFSVLDGDRDGEAPIVCGGTDCDDARARISSAASELCNGIDDDCDSVVDEDNHDGTTACGDRSVCTEGVCICEIGGGWCGDPSFGGTGCADVQNDPMNCGACDRVCLAGRACNAGVCECDPGQTFCETTDVWGTTTPICANTQTDPTSCGGCDRACPDGVACVDGACACPAGETTCGGFRGSVPSCVDLTTDESHCGHCEVQCPAGVTCTDGRCPCPGGGVYCTSFDRTCHDLATDPVHCGACNHECANGTCVAGSCRCAAGETACPNDDGSGVDWGVVCANLSSDPASCGACGHSCGDNRLCVGGVCAGCAPGFVECVSRSGRTCVTRLGPECYR